MTRCIPEKWQSVPPTAPCRPRLPSTPQLPHPVPPPCTQHQHPPSRSRSTEVCRWQLHPTATAKKYKYLNKIMLIDAQIVEWKIALCLIWITTSKIFETHIQKLFYKIFESYIIWHMVLAEESLTIYYISLSVLFRVLSCLTTCPPWTASQAPPPGPWWPCTGIRWWRGWGPGALHSHNTRMSAPCYSSSICLINKHC